MAKRDEQRQEEKLLLLQAENVSNKKEEWTLTLEFNTFY